MNLRTITLVAAIGQTLGTLVLVLSYIKFVTDRQFPHSWEEQLSDLVWIFAQATLAAFLFTLYSKQSKG